MAVVKEIIRVEENGTLSFGNYELKEKTKVLDFEAEGRLYKAKTFYEVTKLKRDGAAAHTLDCEASLDTGEINIYIGVDGEKELLRTIKGGESLDETIILDNKYDDEETIYIVLETVGKCSDGDFAFEYN